MKVSFYFTFFLIIFKISYANTPTYLNRWVVWNVGQGQWVTHILPDECRHYDVGGEFGSFQLIRKKLLFYCAEKNNIINISHWDYDHILNIPSFVRSTPEACWQNLPRVGQEKKSAKKILELNIIHCPKDIPIITAWFPDNAKDTNSSSGVFLDETVLTTGDSPIQKEKIWANELVGISSVRVLILGHHGSRTSTGKGLLDKLSNLKFTIASARYAKYKHPHTDTLKRIKQFQIPVLKTEDWGNIWF